MSLTGRSHLAPLPAGRQASLTVCSLFVAQRFWDSFGQRLALPLVRSKGHPTSLSLLGLIHPETYVHFVPFLRKSHVADAPGTFSRNHLRSLRSASDTLK